MRRTSYTFVCDSCGAEVEKRSDLARFRVETGKGRKWQAAQTDLCADCETHFLATVEAFFPGEEIPDLHAMSREEE